MGDFHSEGKHFFMIEVTWLGLDLAGLDALGEDLEEIEKDFDHVIETDETEEIEQIENLSQNLNEVLSQEANNEVFWNLFIWWNKTKITSNYFVTLSLSVVF